MQTTSMKHGRRIGFLGVVVVILLVASAWVASAATTPTRVKGSGKLSIAPKLVDRFNFDISQDANGNVTGKVKITCGPGRFTATQITAYSVVGNTVTFTAVGSILLTSGPKAEIANVTASSNPNTFSAYIYDATNFNNWFCQPSGPSIGGKMLIPDPHLRRGCNRGTGSARPEGLEPPTFWSVGHSSTFETGCLVRHSAPEQERYRERIRRVKADPTRTALFVSKRVSTIPRYARAFRSSSRIDDVRELDRYVRVRRRAGRHRARVRERLLAALRVGTPGVTAARYGTRLRPVYAS